MTSGEDLVVSKTDVEQDRQTTLAANGKTPKLEVQGLKKQFPIKRGFFSRTVGHVKAVDGVNFEVRHGETLGLVGESGCGKTTTGRVIMHAIDPSHGHIWFDDQNMGHIDVATLEAR